VSRSVGAGLEERGVIVTGAAGGIGSEVARTYAEIGARVLAIDVDVRRLERLVEELPGEGHSSAAVDLTDVRAHDALVAQAEERVGPIRALAHLAAVLRRRHDLADVTLEDWEAQVDVNLKAAFFLNRAVAERMAAGGGGAIVNLSSQGWWTGGFGGSLVYNATKGAVVTMTRGLARTYAAAGVRVNAVAPGLIDTQMLRGDLSNEALDALVEQVPMRRLGTPLEAASVVVFLTSDHASYITGATLVVSGGWLMY
jgi:NAD(P)-dependent dehydrogenase (short-subunit alcohol dehydrogenase family)